jgi:hypothetical protein
MYSFPRILSPSPLFITMAQRTTLSVRPSLFFLFLVLSALLPVSSGITSETPQLQSSVILTSSISATSPKIIFSPYDTIYAAITVTGLVPGSYRADVSWVNGSGSVTQNTPVSFQISSDPTSTGAKPISSHTFYSWFRLMKNGPFKSGMSGKQFDADYLGKWELHIAVNDNLLKNVAFEIH